MAGTDLAKRHVAHSEEGFRGARPQRFNDGAFEYSRRQLELAGVMTLKEFSEIKHSIRTQEYRARLKALEALIQLPHLTGGGVIMIYYATNGF